MYLNENIQSAEQLEDVSLSDILVAQQESEFGHTAFPDGLAFEFRMLSIEAAELLSQVGFQFHGMKYFVVA